MIKIIRKKSLIGVSPVVNRKWPSPRAACRYRDAGALDVAMTALRDVGAVVTLVDGWCRQIASLMLVEEQAQSRTFYDGSGKIVGRSSTDSSGTVTNYDARGRIASAPEDLRRQQNTHRRAERG